jgi:phosphoglucomutase
LFSILRPPEIENIYMIYAESFWGANHLHRILEEAQTIVNDVLAEGASPENGLREEHDRTEKRA